jgi:hypothetical protein
MKTLALGVLARRAAWLVVCLGSLASSPAFGQYHAAYGPLYAPFAVYGHGTTPYSAAVRAEAEFVRAVGEFLVNQAISNKINEEAREHFFRNRVLWVRTFFERRVLNRYFRQALNPPRLVRLKHSEDVMEYRVVHLFQDVLKDNCLVEMNWLLTALAAIPSYSFDRPAGDFDEIGVDAEHVFFTQAARPGSDPSLVWRASDGAIYWRPWPVLLTEPAFAPAREAFERLRDETLEQARALGRLEDDQRTALLDAFEPLEAEFEAMLARRYDESQATGQPVVHDSDYAEARGFLTSLRNQLVHLRDIHDSRAFDGSYRFTGTHVAELVDHMKRNDLQFAQLDQGDRGGYRSLFLDLREMFLALMAVEELPAEEEIPQLIDLTELAAQVRSDQQ